MLGWYLYSLGEFQAGGAYRGCAYEKSVYQGHLFDPCPPPLKVSYFSLDWPDVFFWDGFSPGLNFPYFFLDWHWTGGILFRRTLEAGRYLWGNGVGKIWQGQKEKHQCRIMGSKGNFYVMVPISLNSLPKGDGAPEMYRQWNQRLHYICHSTSVSSTLNPLDMSGHKMTWCVRGGLAWPGTPRWIPRSCRSECTNQNKQARSGPARV